MSNHRPKTAAEILALPDFAFNSRQVVFRCSCGKENTINIPFMPNVRASFYAPDDILFATDEAGVSWMPIETDDGWFRRKSGWATP